MEGLNHGEHGGHGGLILGDETYQVRGAIIGVSQELGSGFLEAVYQECVALEMAWRHIPFAACPNLRLAYRGQPLKQTYIPDFLAFEQIIVELKVVREIAPEHRAQVLNYLKATGLHVGLLANFGCSPVRIERLVL
jgi:GxxExxY protein